MARKKKPQTWLEPWTYRVCGPRDYKFLPADMDGDRKARIIEDGRLVNAILYAQPDTTKRSPLASGDMMATTTPRPAEEAGARAARICACVNACAGMDDPEATIQAMREFMFMLAVRGEYEESKCMALYKLLGPMEELKHAG